MMQLEDKVCSLDLAKKLKELSVEQESLFYWIKPFDEWLLTSVINKKDKIYLDYCVNDIFSMEHYSAFTSDELFDLLPAWIDTKNNDPFNFFYLNLQKRTAENIRYIARYTCDTMKREEINNSYYLIQSNIKAYSPKLADCLAKLLILVKEKVL